MYKVASAHSVRQLRYKIIITRRARGTHNYSLTRPKYGIV